MSPVDPEVAFAPGGAGGPKGTSVKIRRLVLDGDLFDLDGAAKAFSFDVENSGQALTDVTVEATIVQGMATRQAALFVASCPQPDGVLPAGACTMNGQAIASNSAPGTGALVQGDAQFHLTLRQTNGATVTVLVLKKTGIGIADGSAPPFIADLVMTSTTLAIGGASVPYAVTLANPAGAPVGEVLIQGIIRQGTVVRGAGGSNVICPPDFDQAVLPPGNCTMEFTATALGTSEPDGTLQPGPATFELSLLQGFNNTVTLDTRIVQVTLVANEPRFVSIDFPNTNLVINGDRVGYSFVFTNPTSADLTGVLFQGWIVQGTSEAPAGGLVASCGAGNGVVPPGTCTMSFTAGARTEFAPLVPGAAKFVLQALTDGGSTELDLITVAVTLLAPQ